MNNSPMTPEVENAIGNVISKASKVLRDSDAAQEIALSVFKAYDKHTVTTPTEILIIR